jgi:hypothetical protein
MEALWIVQPREKESAAKVEPVMENQPLETSSLKTGVLLKKSLSLRKDRQRLADTERDSYYRKPSHRRELCPGKEIPTEKECIPAEG